MTEVNITLPIIYERYAARVSVSTQEAAEDKWAADRAVDRAVDQLVYDIFGPNAIRPPKDAFTVTREDDVRSHLLTWNVRYWPSPQLGIVIVDEAAKHPVRVVEAPNRNLIPEVIYRFRDVPEPYFERVEEHPPVINPEELYETFHRIGIDPLSHRHVYRKRP